MGYRYLYEHGRETRIGHTLLIHWMHVFLFNRLQDLVTRIGTIITSLSKLLLHLQSIKTSRLNFFIFHIHTRWILYMILFRWTNSYLLRSIDKKEGRCLLCRWSKTSPIAINVCLCDFQRFLLYLIFVISFIFSLVKNIKIGAVSDQRTLESLVTQVRSRGIFRLLLCSHLFIQNHQLSTIFVILSVLKSCLLCLWVVLLNCSLYSNYWSSIMASFLCTAQPKASQTKPLF